MFPISGKGSFRNSGDYVNDCLLVSPFPIISYDLQRAYFPGVKLLHVLRPACSRFVCR
jgi:hypothetical protein